MTEAGYLEGDLEPLSDDDELAWELGGLVLHVEGEGDQGLDDTAELEGEDNDAAGDGSVAGDQRLASRPIELSAAVLTPEGFADDGTASAFAANLNEIRKVVSPLPDRTQGRLLRWRRAGEPAKRISVRPAKGKPLTVPGGQSRLAFDKAEVKLRLEAPDPVILSDEYHYHDFTAGETYEVINEGSFTADQPTAWWLTSTGGVTIENLDFDEFVRFPGGPLTVGRNRTCETSTTYGLCFGPSSTLIPRWPLLRPGANSIRASAACRFYWRDTW